MSFKTSADTTYLTVLNSGSLTDLALGLGTRDYRAHNECGAQRLSIIVVSLLAEKVKLLETEPTELRCGNRVNTSIHAGWCNH